MITKEIHTTLTSDNHKIIKGQGLIQIIKALITLDGNIQEEIFREANNYADALARLRVSHNGSLATYDVCP